ncbi:Zn(2+) transporter ZRT3 Ecym_8106 [Eremothecium cymbalariae DBVPG|uniref:Zinc/iron permease n=1 Tax=Eremothecium cymbalariae (strain CBS 270.75 / DBVPG 7215 / KCTC 17166 / NRRL Y-17582) TaxID=931890 RepID=G8JX26_ERECY|nr:Hypothetical protein Ecym_8106 [Eremothecium cymbalariae DBVPG\
MSGIILSRWIVYITISSGLCIAGGLVVPIVSVYYSSEHSVNSKLLNYGLSVSAGAMLCSSIYTMLPRDQSNMWVVFLGFLSGVTVSFFLDYIIHKYTSESLIHCAHRPVESDEVGPGMPESLGDTIIAENTGHQHPCHRNEDDERLPLIASLLPSQNNSGTCIPLAKSVTIASKTSTHVPSCNSDRKLSVVCVESNIGYDLENLATYREHFISGSSQLQDEVTGDISNIYGTGGLEQNNVHYSVDDHRHIVATPFSKLLSIGIQTCIVITLHKFPEGFIIYFTGNDSMDTTIGFSIFLGLAVHNFIEGFTMTLPLYSAFKSKWLAVLVVAIITLCSQPLGALIGYLTFRNKHDNGSSKKPDMTVPLSLTAGFLFVLALQMFQTAVAFSDTHHHHEDDNGKQIESDHSSGTMCLKWCCFGVLLVLASNAFSHEHL